MTAEYVNRWMFHPNAIVLYKYGDPTRYYDYSSLSVSDTSDGDGIYQAFVEESLCYLEITDSKILQLLDSNRVKRPGKIGCKRSEGCKAPLIPTAFDSSTYVPATLRMVDTVEIHCSIGHATFTYKSGDYYFDHARWCALEYLDPNTLADDSPQYLNIKSRCTYCQIMLENRNLLECAIEAFEKAGAKRIGDGKGLLDSADKMTQVIFVKPDDELAARVVTKTET